MNQIQLPDHSDRDKLFDYLRKNKSILKIAKKATKKEWCPVYSVGDYDIDTVMSAKNKIYDKSGVTEKAVFNAEELAKSGSFMVKLAINTTNLFDSHRDVHIPGIWTKSLKERRLLYHLKSHHMDFEDIISDEVKASAVMMAWKELGFKYEGETQVLLFDSLIDPTRHEYMALQYALNRVKNHSVGMNYVNYFLAMNSDSKYDKEEKEMWDKYYPLIANKSDADEVGYFWSVTEAKVIEGSAVPLGSNYATPVISIEPVNSTQSTKGAEPVNEPLDFGKLALAIKSSTN